MINNFQWNLLRYYRPGDFRHPDKLDFTIVNSLDIVTLNLGVKAQILSDWRPFSADRPGSQHPLGRAIDVTWPGLDTLKTLQVIKSSLLFTGFGLYRNEQGAHSFHLDTRTDRDPQTPATWGALIFRQPDPDTGLPVRATEYTSLDHIVRFISTRAKTGLKISMLGLAVLILWKLMKGK